MSEAKNVYILPKKTVLITISFFQKAENRYSTWAAPEGHIKRKNKINKIKQNKPSW